MRPWGKATTPLATGQWWLACVFGHSCWALELADGGARNACAAGIQQRGRTPSRPADTDSTPGRVRSSVVSAAPYLFSRLGHSAAPQVGIPLVPRLAGSPRVQILLEGFEARKDYGQRA